MNFFSNILKGRFFGHPVHIMLIHFPSAFLPMSTLLDFLSYTNNENTLALFGFYSGMAGSATGIIAALFGAGDLIKISPEKKEFKIALLHGGLNILWISIFSVLVGIQINYYPLIPLPSLSIILIKFIIITGMFFSNFLGGELLLKYGIGTSGRGKFYE